MSIALADEHCLLQTRTLGHIPCIIHQTWKTHRVVGKQRRWMQTWKDMNPQCLHQLWNDTEIASLARLKSPDLIWPIWDGLSPVERADVFRYLVLYERGGYYVDLDVECTTPIAKYPVGLLI